MEPYYSDDHVTLYHGDCREILPTVAANAVVTDPPYSLEGRLNYHSGSRTWSKFAADGELDWDRDVTPIIGGLLDVPGHSIIWGGNYFALPPRRGWLIWDKVVRKFSSGHCELAWTTLDQPVRAFSYAHSQLANEGKFHPTQKPLPLMQWAIRFLPEHCVTILDPFAGSGTTLVAAKMLGRRATGVEIEERYCEIAARRLAQDVLPFGEALSAGGGQ